MDSLIIAFIALIIFGWGYLFYAKKIERIWQIDPKRPTPAYTKSDHVDYIPARNWLVLFGHHFSAIAGAGPIIGPVIAVMLWGWLPALLWVIIGSVFIGGVHDFGSLITSVKEGGNSIADIAGTVISKRAKVIFSLFVWFALILVISVFAYLCADIFVKEPKICLPSLGLIPIALLVGYFLYWLRVNSVIATIFGLVSLLGLILAGTIIPINLSIVLWLIILLVYCYIASILPVNILLQPRDYLSSFLLFFGIGVGYLGLVISRPTITMPYYIKWTAGNNYLWPMLFVTIACGAVSGFHSLIASGTTSKQIANEGHAKRIGYGGMLSEGVLAVLVIIAVAIIFKPGDNFTLELKNAGPIGIFSRGFGLITKGVLGDYGPFIAVTILNAFILTTLDAATRIERYLTEELFGIRNRYISTLIIVSLALALALSGQWNRIWPAFGASNQLVAALALFVLGSWLIAKNKPAKIVLWPAFFMLVTAVGALVFQAIQYVKEKDIVLLAISIILLSLAGFMSFDTIIKISGSKKHG